jgi:hypothetical protein
LLLEHERRPVDRRAACRQGERTIGCWFDESWLVARKLLRLRTEASDVSDKSAKSCFDKSFSKPSGMNDLPVAFTSSISLRNSSSRLAS